MHMGAVAEVVNLDVPGPSIMYHILAFILYAVHNHKRCLLPKEPASVPYLWCLDFISCVDDLDGVHGRDEPGPLGLGGMDAGRRGSLQCRQPQSLVHSLPFHTKQSPATGDNYANCLQRKLMLQATSLSRLVSTSLFH